MAPSATSSSDEIVVQVAKVGERVDVKEEKHAHGAEDKTPLEAISHGPLVMPGEIVEFILVCLFSIRVVSDLG